MAGIESMIAQAEHSLGLGENPNNTNYITRWYGLNDAWCDMAVTYWAWHSNNQNAVTFGGKYAYTVAHAQAFKDRGQWHVDTAGIRRGDIVFFDWAGSNSIAAIDHVGIVTSVSGSIVYTIEGNIGNVCARKIRHANFIAGYGRPKYTSPAPPVHPPTPTPDPPKRPVVDLSVLVAAAKSSTGHAPGSDDDTTRVQNALAKLGFVTFAGRGEFGPRTRAGYKGWQKHLGYTGVDADGIPGIDSLTKLGSTSSLFITQA